MKEALLETLRKILSLEQPARLLGEQQLQLLEVTPEFGIHLVEFTLDSQGDLGIRQLASLILKQYVEAHWSEQSEKYNPPETPESTKSAIRQLLPQGLQDPTSKIRSSVAYAISAIAHWDWPESWPTLFEVLMQALVSGNNHAVHGAMRVLTEFTREVTDTQIPHVAPVIFPEMYRIFSQANIYNIRTRSRAVEIFNSSVVLIHSITDINKNAAKTLLFPNLPMFVEAFIQSLAVPDGEKSDCGLKMEVLKCVTTLIKSFPKQMSPWLDRLLPQIWNTLTLSATIYVRTVVNVSEDSTDAVDSDGEVLGFENLVFGVFDFISGLVEVSKFRAPVRKSLQQLFYYIIIYMQITEEQMQSWTECPDRFVEDEDEDTFSYSVRISGQDLLLSLATEFKHEAAVALCATVMQHLQQAGESKNSNNPHWWKIHESCMLALGSVRDLIIESIQEGKVDFDINSFLSNVVLEDLNMDVSPFLLGRALWVASRFTATLEENMVRKFMGVAVQGLQPSQSSAVRISAVRAIYNFAEHLKSSNIMIEFLPSVMEQLVQISLHYAAETLSLVMEVIHIVLTISGDFTASCENKVGPLAIALFLKYTHDPVVTSLAHDIFKELTSNPKASQTFQARLVHTVCSILQTPAEKLPLGMGSVALDTLCVIVRNSPKPLSGLVINQAFYPAAQVTLSTDDNATMQSGGECLRAYVSEAYDEICQWRDPQENNGVHYVIEVISQLLSPKTSEFTAAFVGKLIVALIKRAGMALGESLHLMLRAVLSKMHQSETLSVMQSLILVFSSLFNTELDAVLDFLSSIPDPTGRPALDFLLTEWCSRQSLFFGAYERKVSTVALCTTIQHVIQSDDQRFRSITVQGDEVYGPGSEGIKTRSMSASAPPQWTVIPIVVKMVKLVIDELSHTLEQKQNASMDEYDLDESWGDDEGASDDETLNGDDIGVLYSEFDGLDDEDDDDPDVVNDPINDLDMQVYLTEFLQQLSQHPCYSAFHPHFNQSERQTLKQIGLQC